MKHFFFFITGLGIFCFFAFTAPVRATELYFGAHGKETGIGETFEVGVFFSTEGKEINAISGVVNFPEDLMEFKHMKDAGSLMNFWVERSKQNGSFLFSGIIPGGFQGDRGYLFSLVFTAKKAGKARFSMKDIKVYLHDGKGTEMSAQGSPMDISFVKNPKNPPFALPNDTELPEPFRPEIIQDPDTFDGKYFLVFQTQDKNSGLNHYEVREGDGGWETATSPYLLTDQELRTPLFVKAVDNAGNERIEVISPEVPPYQNYLVFFLLIGGIILCIILFLRQRRAGEKR